MKLACNQAMFRNKLQEVSRIALHNPASSEYRTVMVQAENGQLTLRCTETHGVSKDIIARLPADVTKSGSALVDAALITELSQTYTKDATISAERRPKHPFLVLTCGDSIANLTLVKRPLPQALPLKEATTIHLQAEPLRQCIASVIHAAGDTTDQNNSNPAQKGVHIILDDYGITAAATDGYRMSIGRHPADNPLDTELRFTLPADTARELTRILTQVKPTTSMDLAANHSRIRFSAETDQGITTELSSGLLQGDFPDPMKLIPTTYRTRAVLSPANAAAAARAANQFSGIGGPIRIYIHYQPDATGAPTPAFTVAAMTPEQADSVHTFPLKQLSGFTARIAINPRFALDAIQTLRPSDEGAIELNDDTSPAVFRNTDETGFNCLSLIMPLHIQWEQIVPPPIVQRSHDQEHTPVSGAAHPPAAADQLPQNEPLSDALLADPDDTSHPSDPVSLDPQGDQPQQNDPIPSNPTPSDPEAGPSPADAPTEPAPAVTPAEATDEVAPVDTDEPETPPTPPTRHRRPRTKAATAS